MLFFILFLRFVFGFTKEEYIYNARHLIYIDKLFFGIKSKNLLIEELKNDVSGMLEDQDETAVFIEDKNNGEYKICYDLKNKTITITYKWDSYDFAFETRRDNVLLYLPIFFQETQQNTEIEKIYIITNKKKLPLILESRYNSCSDIIKTKTYQVCDYNGDTEVLNYYVFQEQLIVNFSYNESLTFPLKPLSPNVFSGIDSFDGSVNKTVENYLQKYHRNIAIYLKNTKNDLCDDDECIITLRNEEGKCYLVQDIDNIFTCDNNTDLDALEIYYISTDNMLLLYTNGRTYLFKCITFKGPWRLYSMSEKVNQHDQDILFKRIAPKYNKSSYLYPDFFYVIELGDKKVFKDLNCIILFLEYNEEYCMNVISNNKFCFCEYFGYKQKLFHLKKQDNQIIIKNKTFCLNNIYNNYLFYSDCPCTEIKEINENILNLISMYVELRDSKKRYNLLLSEFKNN